VHSEAVTKPLVAIILTILSTMFYVFEKINWRWCRQYSTVLTYQEYCEWRRQSVAQGGGAARPPLNPPLRAFSVAAPRMSIWNHLPTELKIDRLLRSSDIWKLYNIFSVYGSSSRTN